MIKYTLLENAIDSIETGIEELEMAVSNSDKRSYKYSILNLFQGTELLLKDILVHKNSIIIFDKNSLYEKCINPLAPTVEELYNCKSIDISGICRELKKYYPDKFDNSAKRIIENIARERNKIQHFAINIEAETIKNSLIQLYGKVIKICFEILNEIESGTENSIGEKIEEIYCLVANADREDKMLEIGTEDYTRGTCHSCGNYSMFIFYDMDSYPTRFYCTSCAHKKDDIQIEKFYICPECGANSLIYDEVLQGGLCLWHKCSNHTDGGVLIDMEFCEECNDYKIEDICECNRDEE